MRTKMRPRYYCDHCNKGGGSASHMKKHEQGCTLNPARKCGFCGAPTDFAALTPLLTPFDGALKRLDEATEGCPGCQLAVIRQSGLDDKVHQPTGEDYAIGAAIHTGFGFDFKAAKDEWWTNVNDDDRN